MGKRLFVVMPFGKVNIGGVERDFDHVYQTLISGAGERAGWSVLRIDEVRGTGSIPNQYLRELLQADLVLADISAPNANVFYEIGIRHAISPTGVLLIAARGTVPPFDLQHQRILFYEPDPDMYSGAPQDQLTEFLNSFAADRGDNPVYAFYQQLGLVSGPQSNAAAFQSDFSGRVERAQNQDQVLAVWFWARQFPSLPVSGSLDLARKLASFEAYSEAAEVLQTAADRGAEDFEIYRQLGHYLSKLGDESSEHAAEVAFGRAQELNRSDPETIGMLGGLYKRQGRYREARECYNRGAHLSPSSTYMRVNQAAMAIFVAPGEPDGIDLYAELLRWLPSEHDSTDYWTELVRGEAAFAVGNDTDARAAFDRALALNADPESLRSAARQLRLFSEVGFRPYEGRVLADYLMSVTLRFSQRGSSQTTASIVAVEAKGTVHSTIFHVSDLHFGSINIEGQTVDMHRFYDSDNSRRLSLELNEEFTRALQQRGVPPTKATIVISGDLTYTGSPPEFELAEHFLIELCEMTGIPRQRVVLVPGNHDVSWNLARADPSHRFDAYLAFLGKFYDEETFRTRYPFLSEWDRIFSSKRPKPNQIVSWWLDGDILYVGLNSCVYEDEQHHYGFVGLAQLRSLSSQLDSLTHGQGVVRVAVLHHHLHPFPEALELRSQPDVYLDMSTVRDAGAVERRLEMYGFDLVLHGHKHKPQLRETLLRDRRVEGAKEWKRLIVSGCGSTGVAEKELEHGLGNHYAIIDVLRPIRDGGVDFAAVEWRELAVESDSEWATQRRWILRG
jgi:3',5'-cyclic AMP phosphodiesterase CpdA